MKVDLILLFVFILIFVNSCNREILMRKIKKIEKRIEILIIKEGAPYTIIKENRI